MSAQGREVYPANTSSSIDSMSSMKPQTFDQLVRYRAKLSPNAPLLWYPSGGPTKEYSPTTALQLDQYVEQAANAYSMLIGRRISSSQSPKTVALLGLADLDYVITLFALCRLGHTALTLSPRLALDGYMHLMTLFDVHDVIYHQSLSRMATSIQKVKPNVGIYKLVQADVYQHTVNRKTDQGIQGNSGQMVTQNASNESPIEQLDVNIESKQVAIILHSSGSTGLPKPSQVRNGSMVMAASKLDNRKAYCCVPFYHGFGLGSLMATVYHGHSFYFHDASIPLTYNSLKEGIAYSKAQVFYCVPYALKLLAESDAGVDVLKRCDEVVFSGSACPDDLGDILTAKGVRIVALYGSSEIGPVMTTHRPEDDNAWNYLRPLPHVRPFLVFEERPEGLCELICRDGYPMKAATNRDDGSFASKDLFERHPTIADAYRFICRQDDTLVLSNGEKTNPHVFEGVVRQHPLVAEAVVFGVGKPELGIMIITSESARPQHLTENEIVEQVWPLIANAQKDMPQYAKINRSMVKILPPSTEYPRTDKSTIIRTKFYLRFAQEIEDAYIDQLIGSRLKLESQEQIQTFILDEVVNMLGPDEVENLTVDTNLFSLGVDSLKSIQLRRTIQSRLEVTKSLPLNVVYDYPTIRLLSKFIFNIGNGCGTCDIPKPGDVFTSLIQEYEDFHLQQTDVQERFTIVLTGATGSLGTHLLAQLLQNKLVDRVYCLVRDVGSPKAASDRVQQALQTRNLYHELKGFERAKIVALTSNLAATNLGLDIATYRVIVLTATTVLHAAWPVNFNMNLSSFKPDIAATKNLLNLCISPQRTTQASFGFCSSVSTSFNQSAVSIPETVPDHLSAAAQMGYAQSKLVAENLCLKAAEQKGVKASIFRIGQIIGDTKNGIWKADEATPLMIQTAQTTGALPDVEEVHRWLPVDITARAILEISLAVREQAPAGTVFNLVNPTSFKWKSDLLPKLREAGLDFEVVSPEKWLARLKNSEQDGVKNPPIKLLQVFESQYGAEGQKTEQEITWDTSNASKYSQTFSEGWELSTEMVQKFVDHFRNTCWQSSSLMQTKRHQSWSSEETLEDDNTDGVAPLKKIVVGWDANAWRFKMENKHQQE